jgi:DNA polymerase-3 subunit epsilon
MPLQLTRPIVFFDFETTGTKLHTDRIIQISLPKYNPDGTEEIKTLLANPGIPIPKKAADVHGITNEMVEDNSQINPSYD